MKENVKILIRLLNQIYYDNKHTLEKYQFTLYF